MIFNINAKYSKYVEMTIVLLDGHHFCVGEF